MKTNIISVIVLIIFLSSCQVGRYLPTSKNVGVNQYGGYIKVLLLSKTEVKGELIAVQNNCLVIMEENTVSPRFFKTPDSDKDTAAVSQLLTTKLIHDCVDIPISEIKTYKVRYAKSKYGWTIPLLVALAATHGWAMIGTIGANIAIATDLNNKSGKYKSKHLSYGDLCMFARYPQGIPPNINKEDIK
jgi:hypothetical protein